MVQRYLAVGMFDMGMANTHHRFVTTNEKAVSQGLEFSVLHLEDTALQDLDALLQ